MNLIYLLSPVVVLTLMIPSTAKPDLQYPTPELHIPTEQERAYNCGMYLLGKAGLTGTHVTELPRLYAQASVRKDAEFLKYVYAIIYVESRFNKQAVSDKGAKGLMQLTEPAILDSRKHCSISAKNSNKLFDSHQNVKLGSCYFGKMLEDSNNDYDIAVVAYNGGVVQANKYERDENIAGESANYLIQIQRAIKMCDKQGVQNVQ